MTRCTAAGRCTRSTRRAISCGSPRRKGAAAGYGRRSRRVPRPRERSTQSSPLDGAREAADRDELAAWVPRFLASPGSDNAPLGDELARRRSVVGGPGAGAVGSPAPARRSGGRSGAVSRGRRLLGRRRRRDAGARRGRVGAPAGDRDLPRRSARCSRTATTGSRASGAAASARAWTLIGFEERAAPEPEAHRT